MAADGLVFERRDPTLSVTIDHGEGNLFSPAMLVELVARLRVAGDDPALRFVRLGARGDVFCLGREGARGEGPPPTPRGVRNVAASVVALNELLQTTPLVVIAEVQGDAAGLGAGLVGCADVAIAAEDARLSAPEILSGFAPTVVIGWLTRTVSRKRAFEMVTTGAWVDAETALRALRG
jgi:methylglutaconyl-CoA hydratase